MFTGRNRLALLLWAIQLFLMKKVLQEGLVPILIGAGFNHHNITLFASAHQISSAFKVGVWLIN